MIETVLARRGRLAGLVKKLGKKPNAKSQDFAMSLEEADALLAGGIADPVGAEAGVLALA